MASFYTAKASTKDLEGGFWNDPSAGWTYAGITKKYYPNWPGFKRLLQLQATQFKGNPIPRYTVFNDAQLEALVNDFYKNNFWNKLNGDYIANQVIANFMYDFFVHKQNDAIQVFNNSAQIVSPDVAVNKTALTGNVVQVINENPRQYYSIVRQARINYYQTKKNGKHLAFSKPMQAAFIKRVQKFPEAL